MTPTPLEAPARLVLVMGRSLTDALDQLDLDPAVDRRMTLGDFDKFAPQTLAEQLWVLRLSADATTHLFVDHSDLFRIDATHPVARIGRCLSYYWLETGVSSVDLFDNGRLERWFEPGIQGPVGDPLPEEAGLFDDFNPHDIFTLFERIAGMAIWNDETLRARHALHRARRIGAAARQGHPSS